MYRFFYEIFSKCLEEIMYAIGAKVKYLLLPVTTYLHICKKNVLHR